MNSKRSLISVVVISYNRRFFLEECITSLLNQSYPYFEIILVDSNSTDSTPEYLETLNNEKKILVIKSSYKSLALKQNIAIGHARGGIIAITDDDCAADKEWLSNIYKEISKEKPVIAGRVLPKDGEFEVSIRRSQNFKLWENNLITRSTAWRCGCGNNIAFYKKLFYDVGKFDENLGTGTPSGAGGDTDFFLRVLRFNKKIAYTPTCIVYHSLPISVSDFFNKKRLYYKSIAYIGLSKYARTPEGWIMTAIRIIHSATFLLIGLITLSKKTFFQRYFELIGSFEGIKLAVTKKIADN